MSPIKWIVLPLHNPIPSIITEQRKSNLFVECRQVTLTLTVRNTCQEVGHYLPTACLSLVIIIKKYYVECPTEIDIVAKIIIVQSLHSVCAINLHLPPHSPPLVMFSLSLSLSSCPLFCCYQYIGCSWLTEWMTGHFTATSQSILFVFHPT